MTEAGKDTLDGLIIEQMSEAVIFSDRNGVIERWNLGAVAAFGFESSEAIGQNMDLMIPEHLRAAHWRGFEAAMKNGSLRLAGRPTLTRGLHESGRKLYVEMSFSLVHDDSGQVVGSVAVARDVTERVERERAARSSLT